MKKYFFLIVVLLICLGVGLYRILEIPGEWYGDISIVHEYVQDILDGGLPWYYSLSAGPLYHYLIAPWIALFGHNYVVYKILSVCIGILGLGAIYLLASKLISSRWAVVTVFLTGTSFWWLAWERLGNSQIIIPAMTALTMWCALQWQTIGQTRYVFMGAAISLLGLFVYPQTWVLPFLYFAFVPQKRLRHPYDIWLIGIIVLFGALWLSIVTRSIDVFTSGYIGSKVSPVFTTHVGEVVLRFVINFFRTMLMFNVHGDNVFRVNIPGSPQLDVVSGIFFLLGMYDWIRHGDKKKFTYIWIPMIVLILPSISPGLPAIEVPNSGRTLGIIPFVYICVVSGINYGFEWLKKKFPRKATLYLSTILLVILWLNFQKYFIVYPLGLSENNTPVARKIAEYVDTILLETEVYLVSCCWSQDTQAPDPKAIYYQLNRTHGREGLLDLTNLTCSDLSQDNDIVIIGGPQEDLRVMELSHCRKNLKIVSHRDARGKKIFTSLFVGRSSE